MSSVSHAARPHEDHPNNDVDPTFEHDQLKAEYDDEDEDMETHELDVEAPGELLCDIKREEDAFVGLTHHGNTNVLGDDQSSVKAECSISEAEEETMEDDDTDLNDQLPAPVTVSRTTSELHELMHQGDMVLDPHYQRDVVWNEKKQRGFIDSILRNYFVPPVVFAIRTLEQQDGNGSQVYVCVDGKQRLTAILMFLDGHIPWVKPNGGKYWFTMSPVEETRGLKKAFPQRRRQEFLSKTLECVEYRDITMAVERDIFQRVQMGVPLTAAEKLAAIDSPYSRWLFTLRQKFLDIKGGLYEHISLSRDRGQDYQTLAHMVFCVEHSASELNPTSLKTSRWMQQDAGPSEELRDQIERVLSDMLQIANDDGLSNRPFVQPHWPTVAPIEFVFCGVLLDKLSALNDLQFKAQQLAELRRNVRKSHKDVRTNASVCRTMWESIRRIVSNLPDRDL